MARGCNLRDSDHGFHNEGVLDYSRNPYNEMKSKLWQVQDYGSVAPREGVQDYGRVPHSQGFRIKAGWLTVREFRSMAGCLTVIMAG